MSTNHDRPGREATAGFDTMGLRPTLLRAIAEQGFDTPTPIQAQAIPPALEGRDILACASTGSGKTAAFLLPLLDRLSGQKGRGTRVLVLTPTRELAAQVADHCEALARHTGLRCAAIFGGVGMAPQEQALRRGVDVIIATPGRLLDHMQYDYARLADIEALVLDEADRMLDMGFLPDIRRVLRALPDTDRQTLLFSATIPAPIVALSRELLRSPAQISVERKAAPARGIMQALYPVPQRRKVDLLFELLRTGTVGNAIVFCRTKHRANRLAEKLDRRGIAVARIHGNRSQKQRTDALEGFREGRYRVLVATDIVARGIDVEALDHVVNFDVPAAAEDYIHRVGRTARAGMTGDAFTFVTPDDEGDVRIIERAVGRRIERRRVEGFDYDAPEQERFEIPIQERIAEIRARKRDERARAAARTERKAAAATTTAASPGSSGTGDGRRRRRRRNPRSGS